MAPESTPQSGNLENEINDLREKCADTSELYREVCALLFFRYGVTPTANKLYQLVRKGSMSAPAEALRAFWENLREKSRVRIEHPDLPPELASATADLVAALWQRAQQEALAGFAATSGAAQRAVAAAREQAQVAEARADMAAQALFQLQAEFSAKLTQQQELERALAKEQGVASTLERQIAGLSAQRKDLAEQLGELQRASELAQERHDTALASAQDALHREHAACEAERGRSRTLQEALQAAQAAGAVQAEHHAAQMQRAIDERGRLEQELGAALGSLAEARAARDAFRRQLEKTLAANKPGIPARRGRIIRRA
jgi:DNA repair exonuclease SbcCD ATPase subunit